MKADGHVYIICFDMQNAPIKIGHTVNPQSRLMAHQISCPNEMFLFKSFSYPTVKLAKAIESRFKRDMKHCNIRGEWFDLSPVKAEIHLQQVIEKVMRDPKSKKFFKEEITVGERKCFQYISKIIETENRIPPINETVKVIGINRNAVISCIRSLERKGYISLVFDKNGALTGLEIRKSHGYE